MKTIDIIREVVSNAPYDGWQAELHTLVVIYTDSIDRCKSSYHTIAVTNLTYKSVYIYTVYLSTDCQSQIIMANISKKLKTKSKEFLLIFHGFRRHYRDIIYLSNTYLRYENLGRVLSIYLMEYYLSVAFRRIQDDLACIDDMYSYIV